MFLSSLSKLGENIQEGVGILYAQHGHKSWSTLWAELRAALRDPAAEAAEVLGVDVAASKREVLSAYREKARKNHPDKLGAADEAARAEAERTMQRLNWAKEVLSEKFSS